MGSSVGGKCPHSGGGCCIREAVYLWGQGVYGESLYLLLNFPLNLKLSLKKKNQVLKKKNPELWPIPEFSKVIHWNFFSETSKQGN